MYDAASAYTTVPGTDDKTTSSSTFPIKRGVLQGDITSPLYFILALGIIIRIYDSRDNKGVSFADVMLHTPGYADDVAIIEKGDEEGVSRLSERVTAIAKGSKKSADMHEYENSEDSVHVACETTGRSQQDD